MPDQPITILLVDDDDVDVRVVLRAFEKQRISNPVVVAHDGIEALAKLRGEDGSSALSGPILVLLDLNMPRMNGHEFLTELRSDPRLSQLLVFVLTTSNDQTDRAAAYEKNVAGYLLKSKAGQDLMAHVPLLQHFMLSVNFPCDSGLAPLNDASQREMVEA